MGLCRTCKDFGFYFKQRSDIILFLCHMWQMDWVGGVREARRLAKEKLLHLFRWEKRWFGPKS